jgi:hypothetical protein
MYYSTSKHVHLFGVSIFFLGAWVWRFQANLTIPSVTKLFHSFFAELRKTKYLRKYVEAHWWYSSVSLGTQESIMSAMIADKKCGICVFLILYLLHKHKEKWTETDERPPLFLGLNGVQGAGKSVLVCAIAWKHWSVHVICFWRKDIPPSMLDQTYARFLGALVITERLSRDYRSLVICTALNLLANRVFWADENVLLWRLSRENYGLQNCLFLLSFPQIYLDDGISTFGSYILFGAEICLPGPSELGQTPRVEVVLSLAWEISFGFFLACFHNLIQSVPAFTCLAGHLMSLIRPQQ